MKAEIAISSYKLGLLSSDNIVQIADTWLSQGIYTDSINFLAMETTPTIAYVGPLFEKAMTELGIDIPSKLDAATTLTRDTIEKMLSCEIDLMEGANFIYWNIHHEITDEFPDGKYLGSNLGLEQIFCWLREIWDCRDGSRILYYSDLPRDKAEMKFLAHLKEESEAWLEKRT